MSDHLGPKTYGSTFPATRPADLSDSAAIAAHDQQAFQALDEMLCHWDRPYRPSYHWMIPVGDDPAAIDLAARCQRYLPAEGLDPIPGPWIHLTVKRAAYQDEIAKSDLHQLVTGVAERVQQIPRFKAELIPLAGSPGAVRLSVSPWEPLMALYGAVNITQPFEGRGPHDVFRPHVGVAYSATRQAPEQIQAAVQRAAEHLSPVHIEVTRLVLAAMRRVSGWYEWTELGSAQLAHTSSTATG